MMMTIKKVSKNLKATAIGVAVFLGTMSAAQAQVSPVERQALIDFYESTNGPNWTNKTGWLGGAETECSWKGVTCSPAVLNVSPSPRRTVIGLELPSNNLEGQISASLVNLNNLQDFNVRLNRINGSMPLLSSFVNLKNFSVRENLITGNVPSLSGLNNLQSFDVSYNQLTGNLPSLSGLVNLRYFSVSWNQLIGSIPSLSELTNLRNFLAAHNNFTGIIPSLSGLTNLEYFEVWSNQLVGNIPSLSGLSNLQQFSVISNQLTGSIPSLSGLTNLRDFMIGNNQLTGNIPSLSGLTNLENFDAAWNQLAGDVPSLSGLSNLQQFVVGRNQLVGSIPSLAGLNNLQNFAADSNQLTGGIPSLSGLSSLQNFSVCNNKLTGNLPSLSGLSGLQSFCAFDNQLTGNIPNLSGLNSLQNFSVYSNQLTGNIPLLSGLNNLMYLRIGNNKLTGSVPSLSDLAKLQKFDVKNNQLTGGMPSLSQLSNLDYFSIENNKITGPLIEPPPALLARLADGIPYDGAYLCNNQLMSSGNAQTDSQWDRINYYNSQNTPWQTCQTSPVVIPTARINFNPPEGGTGACNAIGGNNTFECVATPNPGYTFTGFSGDCVGPTCTMSTTEGNKNAIANFNKIAFNIQTTAIPNYGGTLVCTPNAVSYNGSANCVAQPNEGYEVSSYSGACASTTGTLCTINNVQSDKQAGVTFIHRDQGVYLRFDGYCDVIRFDRVPGSEVFYGRNIPESCDGDALMFARIVQTNNDIFVTVVGGYVQDGSGQSSALKILDLKLDQTRTNLAGNFSAKAVMRGANEQTTQVTGGLSGTWSLNTTKGSGTYAATAAYGNTAANQMRAKAVSKPSLFKQLAP